MTTIVIYVAESDRAVVDAVARAWARIRREDDHIPEVIIDLTPGRPSSCNSVGWLDSAPVLAVNLRSGDRNLTGREVMAFLLHQAAHAIAGPSTASEGRFHSDAYRQAAQRLGLAVDRKTTGGSGWSETSLARGTLSRYKPEITALDRALKGWEPTEQVKASRSSRNLSVAACQCYPPRRIRVSERNLELGLIICQICGKPFAMPGSA